MVGQLLQAIDETFERLLDKNVKTQVYEYLEKRLILKRDEIPVRIEVFSKGIFTLFGHISKQIELNIPENLCSRLGIEFKPREDLSFAGYVASLETY
jgi:hypothetical protein